MTLLDFALGPALEWSLIILVLGVAWRLVGVLLLIRKKDLSKARHEATSNGYFRTIINRLWTRDEFKSDVNSPLILGYTFHIGLFLVVFFFAPHITLFQDIFGLSWPGLPNDLIMLAGAITVAAMVALLIRRMTNPILKIISSFDDYLSWIITLAPVVTGMLAYAHLFARYETMLAIHILSVELLFIWFPFGKLMHAILFIPSRGQLGATFERRGVKI